MSLASRLRVVFVCLALELGVVSGVPMRPDETVGMSEDQLAGIVTRDSMIGVQRL